MIDAISINHEEVEVILICSQTYSSGVFLKVLGLEIGTTQKDFPFHAYIRLSAQHRSSITNRSSAGLEKCVANDNLNF